MEREVEQKIDGLGARIAVIGQGYVGFPLAVAFAEAGFHVCGVDVDAKRVAELNAGMPFTTDVPAADFEALCTAGRYRATTDFDVLSGSDVIIICVPTPLRKSKDPDISYIVGALDQVSKHLHPGQLVVLESTTYPGTTEELLLPHLEQSGLEVGKDIFLAFSPERIDPANPDFKVRDIPKVVGGITPACTRVAERLYRQIVKDVIPVSSPRVAELCKLYENVFRNVNIALANEFSLICKNLGVSSREVIDAAASKPFGFMPFYPGPGIGGHCIPVDPSYLSWKMRFSDCQTRFIQLAEEINRAMPAHVIEMVMEALNEQGKCVSGARVLALGVAYKPNVGDTRESPALKILSELCRRGADVVYADPFVPMVQLEGERGMEAVEVSDQALASADCVLLLTNHDDFDIDQIVSRSKLVVDTRNATWPISNGNAKVVRI